MFQIPFKIKENFLTITTDNLENKHVMFTAKTTKETEIKLAS